MWTEDTISLHVSCEAKDQVNGRMEELAIFRCPERHTGAPVSPDVIGDLVKGSFGISALYVKPKTVEGEYSSRRIICGTLSSGLS